MIGDRPESCRIETSLQRDGFAILSSVLDDHTCDQLVVGVEEAMQLHARDAISSAKGSVVGGRNLIATWQGWRSITATQVVQDLIEKELGSQAGVVRILYFDKPPGKGWALSMHKDRTIAVKAHVDPKRPPNSPYSKPTRKAGVPHVEASTELLEQMLTLRLHLDPMHDDNGPLVVVPGSHRSDTNAATRESIHVVHCQRGDLFVMRPLLSHGSRAADENTNDHRRVLHLECAPFPALPGGYEWHDFVALKTN